MTDNVEECRGKFREVLDTITPSRNVSDDTFLEKIQSYLKLDGKYFVCYLQNRRFHNVASLSTNRLQ